MSGKVCNHLSRSDLNLSKEVFDLMCAGTMLNRAGPTDGNELKMVVLTLLTLDFPKRRLQVAPLRPK